MESLSAVAQQIWDMKYRLKSAEGIPVDLSIEDSWQRVATALAQPESEPEKWAERFFDALSGFRFLPAGRILAGNGATADSRAFRCGEKRSSCIKAPRSYAARQPVRY